MLSTARLACASAYCCICSKLGFVLGAESPVQQVPTDCGQLCVVTFSNHGERFPLIISCVSRLVGLQV